MSNFRHATVAQGATQSDNPRRPPVRKTSHIVAEHRITYYAYAGADCGGIDGGGIDGAAECLDCGRCSPHAHHQTYATICSAAPSIGFTGSSPVYLNAPARRHITVTILPRRYHVSTDTTFQPIPCPRRHHIQTDALHRPICPHRCLAPTGIRDLISCSGHRNRRVESLTFPSDRD